MKMQCRQGNGNEDSVVFYLPILLIVTDTILGRLVRKADFKVDHAETESAVVCCASNASCYSSVSCGGGAE